MGSDGRGGVIQHGKPGFRRLPFTQHLIVQAPEIGNEFRTVVELASETNKSRILNDGEFRTFCQRCPINQDIFWRVLDILNEFG